MATSARNVGADSGQPVLRVILTISAVWLAFWALLAGVLLTVAGPELTLAGEIRLVCLAVFAPPAALLTIGLIGSEALARIARPAGKHKGQLTRTIGLERD